MGGPGLAAAVAAAPRVRRDAGPRRRPATCGGAAHPPGRRVRPRHPRPGPTRRRTQCRPGSAATGSASSWRSGAPGWARTGQSPPELMPFSPRSFEGWAPATPSSGETPVVVSPVGGCGLGLAGWSSTGWIDPGAGDGRRCDPRGGCAATGSYVGRVHARPLGAPGGGWPPGPPGSADALVGATRTTAPKATSAASAERRWPRPVPPARLDFRRLSSAHHHAAVNGPVGAERPPSSRVVHEHAPRRCPRGRQR